MNTFVLETLARDRRRELALTAAACAGDERRLRRLVARLLRRCGEGLFRFGVMLEARS